MSGKIGGSSRLSRQPRNREGYPPIDDGVQVRRARVYAQGDASSCAPVPTS